MGGEDTARLNVPIVDFNPIAEEKHTHKQYGDWEMDVDYGKTENDNIHSTLRL